MGTSATDLSSKLALRSGQWTVDSGQWTVDSGQCGVCVASPRVLQPSDRLGWLGEQASPVSEQ
jgi:hypothetical protein